MRKLLILVVMLALLALPALATTFYVNYTGGDDTNSGLTAALAFKTITKLNTIQLNASDSALFARDETWRFDSDGWIDFKPGTSSGYVTYGAYGSGPKPVFLSSVNMSAVGNWTNATATQWYSGVYNHNVGPMIYNNGVSVSVNKEGKWNLTTQGDSAYNSTNARMYIYSAINPATYYTSIEATTRGANESGFNLKGKSWIIVANLSLKYSSTQGVEMGGGDHLQILDNDFLDMGGAYQTASLQYGNCIQSYGNGTNFIISRNNMQNCYDAGLTTQASYSFGLARMENITYSYNTVNGTRYPFEYFSSYPGGTTKNVLVDHNTMIISSGAYPARGNTYLRLADSEAAVTNFNVTNNIGIGDAPIVALVFFNSTRDYIKYNWTGNISMNYNAWNNTSPLSNFSIWSDVTYTTLTTFKAAVPFEVNGYTGNPIFVPGTYVPQSISPLCTMSNTGSYVGANPCGCVVPFEDYTVNVSTTFCPGEWLLNDSGTSGVILPSSSNKILDCNGSSFRGNNTGLLFSVAYGYNNVTIKNCIVNSGYLRALNSNAANLTFLNNMVNYTAQQNIRLGAGGDDNKIFNCSFNLSGVGNDNIIDQGAENVWIENSTFDNTNAVAENYVYAIYLEAGSNNVRINNNSIIHKDGILSLAHGTNFTNNKVWGANRTTFGQLFFGHNITISGNLFKNGKYRLALSNTTNVQILGNTFQNGTDISSIYILKNCSNTLIDGNTFLNSDDLVIQLRASRNTTISNNYFENTTYYDDYGTFISMEYNCTDSYILNNSFNNFQRGGVMVRQSRNTRIINNTFNQMSLYTKALPISTLSDGPYFTDKYEPSAAIQIVELYVGFIADGTDARGWNYTNKIAGYNSSNINISGNTFSSDVQVYLRIQGGYNVQHDLTNFWYRRFRLPEYLTDQDEFYISNSWSMLVNAINGTNSTIFAKSYTGVSNSSGLHNMSYTISNTEMIFTSRNSLNNINGTVFNLSSPNNDVYNVSNSQFLGLNQDSFTVTLGVGHQIMVGDFEDSLLTASCSGSTITANVPTGNYNVSYIYQASGQSVDFFADMGILMSGISSVWLPLLITVAFLAIVIVIVISMFAKTR